MACFLPNLSLRDQGGDARRSAVGRPGRPAGRSRPARPARGAGGLPGAGLPRGGPAPLHAVGGHGGNLPRAPRSITAAQQAGSAAASTDHVVAYAPVAEADRAESVSRFGSTVPRPTGSATSCPSRPGSSRPRAASTRSASTAARRSSAGRAPRPWTSARCTASPAGPPPPPTSPRRPALRRWQSVSSGSSQAAGVPRPPAARDPPGVPGRPAVSAARRTARTAEPVERRRELPLDHRPFTGPEHHLPQPVPLPPVPVPRTRLPHPPQQGRRRAVRRDPGGDPAPLPGGHGLGGPYAGGVAPDAQQRLGEVRRRGTGAQPLVLPQSLDQPVRVHAPWSRVGVASRNGRGRVGTACAASRTRACGTALRASWTQPRPLRSWCRTESAGTRPRTAAAVRSGPRSRPAGDGTRAVPQPPPAGERRPVVPRPVPRGSGTPAGRAVESALEVPRRPGVGVGQRRDRLHRLRHGVRRGLQNAGGGHRGQDLFVGRVHRCGRIQLLAEHLSRVCPVHGTQQVCGPRRFPPRILGSPVTAPPRTGRAGHPFQRPLRNRGVLVAERLRHRQQFGRPVRITSQSLSEQYQSGPAELLLGTEGHRCRHLRELSGRHAGGGEPGQDLLHMARRGRGPSAAVAIQSGNPAPVPAVPPGRPRGSRAPGPAARPGPWTAPRWVAERWSAGACPPGGGPPIHARQRLPSRMTRATRAGSSFIGT